jgi:hypothetical protein
VTLGRPGGVPDDFAMRKRAFMVVEEQGCYYIDVAPTKQTPQWQGALVESNF